MRHYGLAAISAVVVRSVAVTVTGALLLGAAPPATFGEVRELTVGGFESRQQIVVPGTPDDVWAKLTGDLRPWWDHSFRKPPHRLFLDARLGGTFFETFDDSGNGARHAVVIYADRPQKLVFEGPLGLSGNAVQIVVTYQLDAVSDSTRLRVTAKVAGESQKERAQLVDGVWAHFIVDRFQSYYLRERSRSAR